MERWLGGLGSLVGLGACTVAGLMSCGDSECGATATCTGDVSAAPDAGYAEVPPPPGCDPAADPKDAPACVDDSYALFVDPRAASGGATGSRSAPLATLAAATNLDALAGRPRIYVCNAVEITESVHLPPNVSLIGGFECGSWRYAGAPTQITSGSPSTVLQIHGSTKGVVLSDVALATKDATGDGASSIAVLVAQSKMTFRRVVVEAGKGASGVLPSTSSNGSTPPERGGASTTTATPGMEKVCTCALRGASTGGKGGEVGSAGAEGTVQPSTAAAPGSAGAGGATCTQGGRGGDGASGGSGGKRSAVLGVLTAEGWVPGRGSDGSIGDPGAGGGGGGGTQLFGGGGGGCGGCGGNGGLGGAGGGASIALALLASDVTLIGGSFTAADAGDGAQGGAGDNGQGGGAAGSGACGGGEGGVGAGGGGGAGGAGGVSAAIVRSGGGSIQVDPSTALVSGKSGGRGAGGFFGVGSESGESGEEGLTPPADAATVLEL